MFARSNRTNRSCSPNRVVTVRFAARSLRANNCQYLALGNFSINSSAPSTSPLAIRSSTAGCMGLANPAGELALNTVDGIEASSIALISLAYFKPMSAFSCARFFSSSSAKNCLTSLRSAFFCRRYSSRRFLYSASLFNFWLIILDLYLYSSTTLLKALNVLAGKFSSTNFWNNLASFVPCPVNTVPDGMLLAKSYAADFIANPYLKRPI